MFELIFPTRGEEFSLRRLIRDYSPGKSPDDLSRPMPVTLAWADNEFDDEPNAPYVVTIAKDPELKDVVYSEIVFGKRTEVYNLPIGQKYYWAAQNKNRILSNICSFSIKYELPRCIEIDNITNVRDLGGYKVPGGRVRFDLAFRGPNPEFDEGYTDFVTERGKKQRDGRAKKES